MHVFRCDSCGKDTWVNPPSKATGESRILRQQDVHTGDIQTLQVPEVEDLKPRTYIVYLQGGLEKIQKDFCEECYKEHIKPLLEPLWDKLASFTSK